MRLSQELKHMSEFVFLQWAINRDFVGLEVTRPGEGHIFHHGEYPSPASNRLVTHEAIVIRAHDALRGWLDVLGNEVSRAYDRLYVGAVGLGGNGDHPWAAAPLRDNSTPTRADQDVVELSTDLRARGDIPLSLRWIVGDHHEHMSIDIGTRRRRGAMWARGVAWHKSAERGVDDPVEGIESHGKARMWLQEQLFAWHTALSKEATAVSADLAWKLMATVGYPMRARLDEAA